MLPEEATVTSIAKFTTTIFTAIVALMMAAAASFAASEFEGTWSVTDTSGKAFEITLASDGTAKANRSSEGMTGTWKEEGTAAIIKWNTGWTTMIAKDGDKYTKTAFKKGEPTTGKPINSSPAEKTK
jgi:hypothetical protein